MVLGMSLSTFTLIHVLISLAGIGSGLIVVYGMLTRNRMDGLTAFFLATTILTDLTGYLFPVEHILPSHIVGAISLTVLAIALVARYARRMGGFMALDLCGDDHDRALSECVRGRGAVVPQDSSGARSGSHEEGTSVSGGSASRDGGICSARRFRGEEVPDRTGRRRSCRLEKSVLNDESSRSS
jgi:hypothetical protein